MSNSNALLRPSGEVLPRPRRTELRLWALGVLVGLVTGFAVVVFRSLITYSEFVFFGAVEPGLVARLPELPWWRRLGAPILAGLLIAGVLRLGVQSGWGPSPRPYGFTDVIAARRLRGTLHSTTLALRDAFLSALASILSIGAGGSGGREGPAIHLGAAMAMLPGRLFGVDLVTRRILIGMGAAAALAAVLHAPLAAVLFTREVLLPRHRLTALGPVAVASVFGWITARGLLGPTPVLDIPAVGAAPLTFAAGALALAPVLTLLAWGAVYVWTQSSAVTLAVAERRGVPTWTLPAIGGVLLGMFCLGFPLVMGVGYTPVSAGLGGFYRIDLMLVLAFAKIASAAVTFGFRWGGGPIAPMIYIGAMFGSVAGALIGHAVGDASGGQVYFGLIGMAVALTVLLEAPLFAAVLVLELSSSPETAAAALACACLALYLVRRFAPPLPEPGEDRVPLRWR
ncbi:MAG: chloride channel protein [Hyphomonadaceae bacterium]